MPSSAARNIYPEQEISCYSGAVHIRSFDGLPERFLGPCASHSGSVQAEGQFAFEQPLWVVSGPSRRPIRETRVRRLRPHAHGALLTLPPVVKIKQLVPPAATAG